MTASSLSYFPLSRYGKLFIPARSEMQQFAVFVALVAVGKPNGVPWNLDIILVPSVSILSKLCLVAVF